MSSKNCHRCLHCQRDPHSEEFECHHPTWDRPDPDPAVETWVSKQTWNDEGLPLKDTLLPCPGFEA